jgi:catechol 2,3-dioxygenase-like lactoylglutathione lyase family enzyme
MKPICSNTVFHVTDLEKSLTFYQDVLGFEVDFKYGDPIFYAGLSYGVASLHIGSKYPYKNNTGHGHIYITCDEVDLYYKKLVAKGTKINSLLGDQEYGMRDFNIFDPDGNMIGFGASIEENS